MSLILPYAQAPIGGRPGQGIHGMRKRVRAVRLDGTAGTYISTPSHADYAVGDFEAQVYLAMDAWAPTGTTLLLAKSAVAGQRSFEVRMNTTGRPELQLSTDGTALVVGTATAATGVANRAYKWLKVTWRASDGRVQFFLADDGRSWGQLGADAAIAIASIFPSTSALEIGARNSGAGGPAAAKVRAAVLKNGIDGTVVANPDFTKAGYGSKALTDPLGRVFTLNGTAHVQAA